MNKLVIAGLATGLLVVGMMGSAKAYEVERNPDRRISFGLSYIRDTQRSELRFGSLRLSDFSKQTGNSVLLDVKVPLSSYFTFRLLGGFSNATNDIFTGEEVKWSGHHIGLGIRLYLP